MQNYANTRIKKIWLHETNFGKLSWSCFSCLSLFPCTSNGYKQQQVFVVTKSSHWFLPLIVALTTTTAAILVVEPGEYQNDIASACRTSSSTTSKSMKIGNKGENQILLSLSALSSTIQQIIGTTHKTGTAYEKLSIFGSVLIKPTFCDKESKTINSIDHPQAERSVTCMELPSSTTDASFVSTEKQNTWSSWLGSWIGLSKVKEAKLPRVIHPNDSDLTVPVQKRRQRIRDEAKLRKVTAKLQSLIKESNDLQTIAMKATTTDNERISILDKQKQFADQISLLIQQTYDLLYGTGITPSIRQQFIEQYGCTGWTEEVIMELIELTGGCDTSKGYIEIGAGNGQWARALTDRYMDIVLDDIQYLDPNNNSNNDYISRRRRKKFDYVLAYDNMSQLPLDPNLYTERTKVYRQYFFHNVQHLETTTTTSSTSSNNETNEMDVLNKLFQQWQCRGRILLLIYPPPGPMAYNVIRAYSTQPSIYNANTVVYVGEGRGGANANDDFFDYLEGKTPSTNSSNNNDHKNDRTTNKWILMNVLPVKVCGTKGYEKLYVLKRVSEKKHK